VASFGRTIGLVFLLPFLYFVWKGKVDRSLTPKLVGIFILGGLQGAMGWYMVKSGLVDDPRVSQYRLTAHLSLAFLIFAAMVWVALGLLAERTRQTVDATLAGLRRAGLWLLVLVFYMIVTGGFVAGIRAGKAYNTFPLMNGHVVPRKFIIDLVPQLLQQHGSSSIRSSAALGAGVSGARFWRESRPVQPHRRGRQSPPHPGACRADRAASQRTLGRAIGTGRRIKAVRWSCSVFCWLNHELRVAPALA
jgi:heme A synthase